MIKIQIGYKFLSTDKELSFTIVECRAVDVGVTRFMANNPKAIVYFIVVCGRS
jgi:hypothetical protein